MLVLAATKDPHGTLESDRHFALEGELVVPVLIDCPDRHCDVCARGWFGLDSHAATTAAIVVERPGVTEAQLRRLVHEWLDCQGVIDAVVDGRVNGCGCGGDVADNPVDVVAQLVEAHVREVQLICANFGPGTVVSRLGELVSERVMPYAA